MVLQLCCSYTVWHMYCYFTHRKVSHFYICTFRSMCTVPSTVVFGSSFRVFPVCSSGVSWMNLRWFQLPLLLMASRLFFTFHMTCISIVRSLYLESSQLISWPHFCLLNYHHPLTHRFLFIITDYDVRDSILLLLLLLPSSSVHLSFSCDYLPINPVLLRW